MKMRFKSKSNTDDKRLRKIILFTILFIFIFTFFLLKYFSEHINEQLIEISSLEIRKKTYQFLTNEINHDILNQNTIQDILVIHKNQKDEILYVDFNLDKAYQVLDQVSDILTHSYEKIESGEIDVTYADSTFNHKSNGIMLSIPIGSVFNSIYFYNIGPKIPVQVNFVGTVLTNLETKVTNYGLNNALVEVFVYMEFHNQIIAPFETADIPLKYTSIIASMMIEGEVPSFYNGEIAKESNIYSKTVE